MSATGKFRVMMPIDELDAKGFAMYTLGKLFFVKELDRPDASGDWPFVGVESWYAQCWGKFFCSPEDWTGLVELIANDGDIDVVRRPTPEAEDTDKIYFARPSRQARAAQ